MPEAEQTVKSAIRKLLKRALVGARRGRARCRPLPGPRPRLLEVAELSAALEDDLGSDPYSEGLTPRTVGEIADFYDK